MISSFEAKLITAEAQKAFCDRTDVKAAISTIESDIKGMAERGFDHLHYDATIAKGILGVFSIEELSAIQRYLEGFGFVVSFRAPRVIGFFAVSWRVEAE